LGGSPSPSYETCGNSLAREVQRGNRRKLSSPSHNGHHPSWIGAGEMGRKAAVSI